MDWYSAVLRLTKANDVPGRGKPGRVEPLDQFPSKTPLMDLGVHSLVVETVNFQHESQTRRSRASPN